MRKYHVLHKCGHERTINVTNLRDERAADIAHTEYCPTCANGRTTPDCEFMRVCAEAAARDREERIARDATIDANIQAERGARVAAIRNRYGVVRIDLASDCWRVVTLRHGGIHRVTAEFSGGAPDGPPMPQGHACSCGNPDCSAFAAAFAEYCALDAPAG